MKKLISIMLAVIMMMALVACGDDSNIDTPDNINGVTGASKNEYFIWYADTIIEGLTEDGMNQKHLVIPAECEEVSKLTSTVLETISFENPDTKISMGAFANCTSLKKVELPDNLQVIESAVFDGCTSLEEIVIPDTVMEIGYIAFDSCSSLKNVVLGSGVTVIDNKAFSTCVALESIEIPNSVVTIEKRAFDGCTSLAKVTFGSSVESIGESAFEGCASLTIISLPDSVKTIDAYAFGFCDALAEVYMPAGIESMDSTALAQTHNFKLYLTQGSYVDQIYGDLMGNEYMEKIYQ